MGLLNNENEDVTNVTSESSNSCTSLKFQRTRWKWSGAWTWTMSPPSTSGTTCIQHSHHFIPLPHRSLLTQCILQYHLICNLQVESVKMNEQLDGREDHPLILSMPWYLTQSLYFQTEISPNASRHLDFTLMKPSTSPILPMQSSEMLHSNTNATTRIS